MWFWWPAFKSDTDTQVLNACHLRITVHGKLAQIIFIIKQNQRHHFPNKYLYSQGYGFSSSDA